MQLNVNVLGAKKLLNGNGGFLWGCSHVNIQMLTIQELKKSVIFFFFKNKLTTNER